MPLFIRIILFVISAAVVYRLYVKYPLRGRIVLRKVEETVAEVHRKTSSQVRSYLESRGWYREWLECLEKTRSRDEVKQFSHGDLLDMSIIGAFDWNESPQGYDVWYDRNCDFLLWYRDEPSFPEGSPDGPSEKDGS